MQEFILPIKQNLLSPLGQDSNNPNFNSTGLKTIHAQLKWTRNAENQYFKYRKDIAQQLRTLQETSLFSTHIIYSKVFFAFWEVSSTSGNILRLFWSWARCVPSAHFQLTCICRAFQKCPVT